MGGSSPRPLRRRTFIRDVVLLALHLAVYVVIVGSIVFAGAGGVASLSVTYSNFDAIFWPSFVWGTVIAAQAGATLFQRRRVMGAVLGAMASVLLGAWILGQLVEYGVVAIVFRSIAVVLIGLSLGISLVRRPPAFMLTGGPVASPRLAGTPVLARPPRGGMISFPNVLLGMFALVFVLAGVANGTYRALEVRGSGEAGQRQLAPGAFDRITVSGTGRLEVRQGAQAGLAISGDENLLQYVETSASNGNLQLEFDPGGRGSAQLARPLLYVVTTPVLTGLTLGGDIDATIDPSLGLGSLRVVLNNEARFTASDLSATTFSGAVRDQGALTLSGQVDSLTLEANDNAVVELEGLAANQANVAAWGASLVSLGQTGGLRYQQAGVATIECAVGTMVLAGSVAEQSQCGDAAPAQRDPSPYDGTAR